MNRRALLAVGATAAASLAGCFDAVGTPPDGSESDPLYLDGRDVPDDTPTHHLFVENADEETYPATLTVTRASDDALVWEAAYDVPDGRGFKIPDLLVEGRTYEVTLDIHDGARAIFERDLPSCPEKGSRNVGVLVEDGDISIRQDECDALRIPTYPVGPHEGFMRE